MNVDKYMDSMAKISRENEVIVLKLIQLEKDKRLYSTLHKLNLKKMEELAMKQKEFDF